MTLGFTGTRSGCTKDQIRRLPFLLYRLKPSIVHHGACQGADREFHYWATHIIGGPRPIIEMWPSNVEQEHWALQVRHELDRVHQIKPPLERNHDVVDNTERLIATPKTMREEIRSGTWSTVRYARKLVRPIYIIWPNGVMESERIPENEV